jgi:glutamate decarboxylase
MEKCFSFDDLDSCPLYSSSSMRNCAPKAYLPKRSMSPRIAKQLISDELSLDGRPNLNLASFVTTFMEKEAEDLMIEAMRKNFIDLDE